MWNGSDRKIPRAFAAIALPALAVAWADIAYVPETNTISIENFAEPAPCTVRDLRLTDKISGWQKVSYDAEADVTTVNANLQIGRPNGQRSYFQIGTEDSPRETLVVNGNLEVCPGLVFGVSASMKNNGLLIGSPGDPKIRGTLKLARGKALNVGQLESQKGGGIGGSLVIHNGAILPAKPGERWGKRVTRFSPKAQVVLRNATIAGFNGSIYGLNPHWPGGKKPSWMSSESFNVGGCTFEDGGSDIVGKATIRGCAFRSLEQAVVDYGGLDATFERCVFRGNRANFVLRFNRGVTCVDCGIGPPTKADIFSKYTWGDGRVVYPQFVSKRSFRVKVLGADGAPVPKAKVNTQPENPEGDPTREPELSDLRSAVAGDDGLTPAGAVLLTEQLRQATDKPGVVNAVDYRYTVAVEANGRKARVTGYKPKTDDVVTVRLDR